MSRQCTVCAHLARVDIDRAILRGDSERAIASRFASTQAAVHRHKAHVARLVLVPEPPTPSLSERRRPLDAIAMAHHVLEEAARIGALAETAGDLGVAMSKLSHIRGILDLAGKRPEPLAVEAQISDEELDARVERLRARLLG